MKSSKKPKKSSNKKNKLPFSKKIVEYSRIECWVVSIVLLLFVWFNKDVSSLSELITVSWVGYNALKLAYIWMCKHEHIYDKKKEMLELGYNTDELDIELQKLENEEI